MSLADLLAGAGVMLARLDDVDYLAVRAVYAWPKGGAPDLYCLEDEWPRMPAAKMAELQTANEELAALAERNAAEVVRLAAEVASLKAQLAERPPTEADIGSCPDCGKDGWKSAQSLQMHRQRVHQGMQAPSRKSAQLLDDDPGWRCAEKGCSGAFTRSLSDPAHCTQHAIISTNGVLQ